MREKVEESLYSKMQPVWMHSEDKRLSAHIEHGARFFGLYLDHPKRKPFKVALYCDGQQSCEFYCESIAQAHDYMRSYVEEKEL